MTIQQIGKGRPHGRLFLCRNLSNEDGLFNITVENFVEKRELNLVTFC